LSGGVFGNSVVAHATVTKVVLVAVKQFFVASGASRGGVVVFHHV